MRVTFNSTYAGGAADLARANERLAEAQREVSSGKRVQAAGDDPAAASGIVRERAELATTDQFRQSADSASSRLSVLDTVLSNIVNTLTNAQAAVLSAQGSTPTAAQREAAANELVGIRDSLFSDFNTALGGSYLFAGSATLDAPYTRAADGTVSDYRGTPTRTQLEIGRGTAVDVTVDGDAIAQGGSDEDVFATIDKLIAAVRSADQDAMADGAVKIKDAFNRTVAAQSEVGSHMKAVDIQQVRLGDLRRAGEARISKYRDANMAEAISRMSQADTAYRAALAAVGRLGGTNLMDYLK